MSRGLGAVERKIAELFRRSGWLDGEDRSFTVTELCREVFGCDSPTRAQRVSAVRATRNVIRQARANSRRKSQLSYEAWKAAEARFGKPRGSSLPAGFREFLDDHPSEQASRKINVDEDLALWRETALKDRTLLFHEYSRPARVWAVNICPEGVIWADAEIVKITHAHISVVYKGVRAPLKRPLKVFGSWWRGVRFVDERSGFIAKELEDQWRKMYGHLVPERMPLRQAQELLGLADDYSKDDIVAGFRRAAKCCHPDAGGTAEMFRKLVEARDQLLASLGTSAPPPKEPDFTPKGQRTVYVSVRTYARSIGGSGKLLIE